jgi:YbgC/YbaW family acyl-CoA thioester hydrolase
MSVSHSQIRRVAFAETDMAGIMHFSNFFRWMEDAEHAFYRSYGLSVHPRVHGTAEEPAFGWPRVSARCDYHAPLFFEEEVRLILTVAEVRTKSVRFQFEVRKTDDANTLAALGEIVAVSVTLRADGQGMQSIPIPENYRQVLEGRVS